MSNLVVYGNDFNFMPLPKVTELEIDIFMKIISELKENRELECSFDEFYFKFYQKKHKSIKEAINAFDRLADSLLSFKVKYSVKDRFYSIFVCFEKLKLEKTDNGETIMKIKAQEDFFELITNLQLGFTQFELKEFIDINGKYTKNLYRLLKQFRNTGKVLIYTNNWQEFYKIMQIPENYTQSKIDERILNPAIKELSKYFKNLTYKKIKDTKSKGRGGKVIGIEFYFKAENEPIEIKKEKTKQKPKSEECYLTQKFKNKEERKKYIEGLIQQEQQGTNVGTIIVK